MDNNYLAELLFGDIKTTPEDMFAKYPARTLPDKAAVTRFAPSPLLHGPFQEEDS